MRDLKLLADFLSDFWEYIKKYFHPPATPPPQSWWDAIISDARALAAKHGGHRLAQLEINAFLQYLEETYDTKGARS